MGQKKYKLNTKKIDNFADVQAVFEAMDLHFTKEEDDEDSWSGIMHLLDEVET
jgi:hypothetical protein